ncbi:glycosyltransferase family 4 protein [uncultured Odoribacter sp.]|uniref:glycosyltransferase family 4 protein n=1 Tax=uncultured Odoribacter sp. TaxID=876416 RepID=UPI00263510A4|nr:glycosyltransferase family 4 protein [uncultured Odoribacter sp.]
MNRIKVAWLCHLTSPELNQYYGTDKKEIAAWIPQFIDVIKNQTELEIHIIAPNYYTNKNDDFEINRIHYHLFKFYSTIIPNHLSTLFFILNKGRRVKSEVNRIVEKINPDIVHLYGSENFTYSEGILPLLGKYKVLISIQGLISDVANKGNLYRRYIINQRIQIENEINSEFKNFTFSCTDNNFLRKFLDKYPGKNVYELIFPTKIPSIDATTVKKEFDLVFWGRISVNKGIEDFIQAVAILSRKKNNFKALIVGSCSEQYYKRISQFISNYKIKENIVFAGYQKSDNDLFAWVSKAKVYALPTYFDAMPGSIRESMFLKIPVVSYPVGLIPEFNKSKKCILLAKERDIEDLAEQIWTLLNNKALYGEIVDNAYDEIKYRYSNERIYGQLMKCYNDILHIDSKKV